MKKTHQTIPSECQHPPHCILTFEGYLHGNMSLFKKTDSELQDIFSQFVDKKIEQFYDTCSIERACLEKDLDKHWANAKQLLIDLAIVSVPLKEKKKCTDQETDKNLLAEQKNAAMITLYSLERELILQRLSDTSKTISTEIDELEQKMHTQAEALQDSLLSYGQGLFNRTMSRDELPTIAYSDFTSQIINRHKLTWTLMTSSLDDSEELEALDILSK